MKKISWNWKKITAIILGTLGIGTLTSCYGMPINDDDFDYEDEASTTQSSDTTDDSDTTNESENMF